ncbi:MAG: LysM peptidoglycan-binding domain-containing protein [Mycobacterium sp.]|nr:LysM peptidoglycan-binding domain-containing protein [Mycobacterium sp.]
MTVIHTVSPRARSARRPISGPVPASRYGRESRRPGQCRAVRPAPRYNGTGVAVSAAPHRARRPVTWATSVGLALGAGAITLWLGLVGHVGQVLNGESTGSSAHPPERLAIVRVEPGESLDDLAHRVAPAAPARRVAERIRDLNDLLSPALAAGQALIAPVG